MVSGMWVSVLSAALLAIQGTESFLVDCLLSAQHLNAQSDLVMNFFSGVNAQTFTVAVPLGNPEITNAKVLGTDASGHTTIRYDVAGDSLLGCASLVSQLLCGKKTEANMKQTPPSSITAK
jgi:hypothetical protein